MDFPSIPDGADRDFTASAFIVDENDGVVLIKHRKLGTWLQPGGHIEDKETPAGTARREALEETGIEIAFHPDFLPDEQPEETHNMPQPFAVNLHQITDDHWHLDFGYLATVEQVGTPTHPDEHDGMRWVTRNDLATLDMPANTRQTVKEVLDYRDEHGL